MTDARKPPRKSTATSSSSGFSAEERAAMKERAAELKTARRTSSGATAAAVVEKIAAMPEPDRHLAERIHEIVVENAPSLVPKLWYGMPAYALDGTVLCFFQGADKFSTRYSTLAFNDIATLDDGTMWPTAFGLTSLTPSDEAAIAALVVRAVSADGG